MCDDEVWRLAALEHCSAAMRERRVALVVPWRTHLLRHAALVRDRAAWASDATDARAELLEAQKRAGL